MQATALAAPVRATHARKNRKKESFDGRPTWGKDRHSAFIFAEYEDYYRDELGVDIYGRDLEQETANRNILRQIPKYRNGLLPDDLLDQAVQDTQHRLGVLSKEERQAKCDVTLAKARAKKGKLSQAGLSDAARFGFCKRTGCANRKTERLLMRGFCPECRGSSVKQKVKGKKQQETPLAILEAMRPADAPVLSSSSIEVCVKKKNIHPDTLKMTREERHDLVLKTRTNFPSATVREIEKETGVSIATVSRILKNPIFTTKPVNTPEVEQFLKDRAERQNILKLDAKLYLENRKKRDIEAQDDFINQNP